MKWKQIPGYSRYEVSDTGLIRRKPIKLRNRGTTLSKHPAMSVATTVHHGAYVIVGLVGDDGIRKQWRVHRLVLLAHGAPRPSNEHFCNHINGIKTDNRIGNLEWVTRRENMQHAKEMGLHTPQGSGNGRAKLTEKDIPEIRGRIAAGETNASIAANFNVSDASIWWIRKGVTWKHV